jgi:hypothetical protein
MPAPIAPPTKVPGPPSTTISSASTEVARTTSSGLTRPCACAHSTPASPPKPPAMMNAMYLCSQVLYPRMRIRSSFSRMPTRLRPNGDLTRMAIMTRDTTKKPNTR